MLTAENSNPVFSSIKEVAKQLSLPSHVLRFWETKFPEIKPVKKGNGCRYYRQEDVELLSRIKFLLYEKRFTIEGARSVLKSEKKGNTVSEAVADNSDVVKSELKSLQTFLHNIVK